MNSSFRHSLNGLLLCGGDNNANPAYVHDTCLSFINGSWMTTHTLKEARSYQSSWEVEKDIILIGGFCSADFDLCNNTEVVPKGNTTLQEPFSLKHITA